MLHIDRLFLPWFTAEMTHHWLLRSLPPRPLRPVEPLLFVSHAAEKLDGGIVRRYKMR